MLTRGGRPSLCKTCPFHPGREREGWEPHARTNLLKIMEDPFMLMECHHTPKTPCSGFLRTIGAEANPVRVRLRLGWLDPKDVVPLPGGVQSFAELDALCEGAENWD